MLRLAQKAFWPARLPFPVMHVDTGHNFTEVMTFRDQRVAHLGVPLVVASVQARSTPAGSPRRPAPGGRGTRSRPGAIARWRSIASTPPSVARRDEDKARAKERVY